MFHYCHGPNKTFFIYGSIIYKRLLSVKRVYKLIIVCEHEIRNYHDCGIIITVIERYWPELFHTHPQWLWVISGPQCNLRCKWIKIISFWCKLPFTDVFRFSICHPEQSLYKLNETSSKIIYYIIFFRNFVRPTLQ